MSEFLCPRERRNSSGAFNRFFPLARGLRRDLANGDAIPSQQDPQEKERDHHGGERSRAATLRRKLQDLDLEEQKWYKQDARHTQFNTSLKTVEEEFRRTEAEHDSAFRDAESRQIREWQENEEKRNTNFKARETVHELAFEEQHNAQKSRSVWIAGLVDGVLQEDREKRAQVCKELEKRIAKVLKKLLRSQGKAFKQEERRLDSTAEHLVSALGSSFVNSNLKLILDRKLDLLDMENSGNVSHGPDANETSAEHPVSTSDLYCTSLVKLNKFPGGEPGSNGFARRSDGELCERYLSCAADLLCL